MELGEKIRLARLEAGLSQRQLCGEEITRNMLSQIEHGTAKPSMKTLTFLAARLDKPVGYFLDEEALVPANHQILEVLSLLKAAEEAIAQEKYPYARQLLERAENCQDLPQALERSRLLLLGQLPGEDLPEIVAALPSLDLELFLRAEAALTQGDFSQAEALLAAVQEQAAPQWHWIRGRIDLQQKQFSQAAEHLQKAESAYPKEVLPLLETCFRELGDFQQAYLYACKQRG